MGSNPWVSATHNRRSWQYPGKVTEYSTSVFQINQKSQESTWPTEEIIEKGQISLTSTLLFVLFYFRLHHKNNPAAAGAAKSASWYSREFFSSRRSQPFLSQGVEHRVLDLRVECWTNYWRADGDTSSGLWQPGPPSAKRSGRSVYDN